MLTNRNATEANGHAKPLVPASSVTPKPVVGFHGSNGHAKPPVPGPSVTPAPPKPVVGFHGAVGEFKRRLIEATLAQAGGNRTRAAKALGLQRTYLLRLMREFQIHFPAALPPHRSDRGQSSPPPSA